MIDLTEDDGSDSNLDGDLPQININSASSSQYQSRLSPRGSENEDKETNVTASRPTKKRMREEKLKKQKETNLAILNNKMYKPGDCMKHMYVEMHSMMLDTWYCADISRELTSAGAHLRSSSTLCDTSLVLWSRSVDSTLTNVGGMVELSASRERCHHGLYISTTEEVATHVRAGTLTSHMNMAKELAGCALSLVVFGFDDYFKSGRKTNNSSRKLITRTEYNFAVTDLLVSADVDAMKANTASELALHVLQHTKAMAEAPYKEAKRQLYEKTDFYMKGDSKNCVSVDKDGNGVERLWQQMLAVLPQSSLPIARAIAAQYPTARSLYEVLKSPGGVEKVAAMGVNRAEGGDARARGVGTQMARRLHTLLTSEDGDQLIE